MYTTVYVQSESWGIYMSVCVFNCLHLLCMLIIGFSNIYEGTSLAAYENVVVVSINYRLGVFGEYDLDLGFLFNDCYYESSLSSISICLLEGF